MSEAAHSFHLAWTPVRTPARNPWLTLYVLGALGLGLVIAAARKS